MERATHKASGMKNGKQNGRSKNGQYTKGENGGAHGQPGRSGRKPVAFLEECGGIVDEIVLPKVRRYLAKKGPDDSGFRWAADRMFEYSKSRPAQVVEHTGEVLNVHEHRQAFESRMDRLTQRLGAAAFPEFDE